MERLELADQLHRVKRGAGQTPSVNNSGDTRSRPTPANASLAVRFEHPRYPALLKGVPHAGTFKGRNNASETPCWSI